MIILVTANEQTFSICSVIFKNTNNPLVRVCSIDDGFICYIFNSTYSKILDAVIENKSAVINDEI